MKYFRSALVSLLLLLMGTIRGTGALLRGRSWHMKTVQLDKALNKYVMGVWSNNFTAAFFVSFIVAVFAPDLDGIQNKFIFMNWNNVFSEYSEQL